MADTKKNWYWDLSTGRVKGHVRGKRCTEESIEHWANLFFCNLKYFESYTLK